jgi:hypothetical protein
LMPHAGTDWLSCPSLILAIISGLDFNSGKVPTA